MQLSQYIHHPSPQFSREEIIDLNGIWHSSLGDIRVPFAPESKLSGLAHTDFIEEITYTRTIVVPEHWRGKQVLLHFDGVDYECIVTLDGQEVGRHTGGATSFCMNIAPAVHPGTEQFLRVDVKDHTCSGLQATGKQSQFPGSIGCVYTRVTGIWGDVWMEPVSNYGLCSCRIIPDVDNSAFVFLPRFFQVKRGNTLTVQLLDDGHTVAEMTSSVQDGVPVRLTLDTPKLWSPSSPFLYQIRLVVKKESNDVLDEVWSYAGMRKVHIEGNRLYLNNQPIFLRMVLDQGYYPDGLWTPPDTAALKHDIDLAMNAGFNGARLHQKVFCERFYFLADQLGYLVWSEFPDWGMNFWHQFHKCPTDYHQIFRDYLSQWREVLEAKVNHPSIIAWTPLNETEDYVDWEEHRRIVQEVYDMTRSFDPTRPVNDTSGYSHVKTDLWTIHPYDQEPDKLKEKVDALPIGSHFPECELPAYHNQPYIIDEFGGVKYIPEGVRPYAEDSWGYGEAPKNLQEALERIAALTQVLVENPRVAGYCYTQLTDIEQEQNGIYTYSRGEKFPMDVIRKIFSSCPEWSFWK